MSYILEALKKSQSDRELGQVPRVQGFGIDVPMEPPRSRPWAYLALLLALLAVGVGVLVLLRGLSTPAPDAAGEGSPLVLTPAAPSDLAARALSAPAPATGPPQHTSDPLASAPVSAPPAPLAPQLPPPTREPGYTPSLPSLATETFGGEMGPPGPAEAPATTDTGPSSPASPDAAAGAPLPLDAPDSLSVEPEILVVPAPAKPGEPLPRGAEELRRAALGDAGRLSASVDGVDALPHPPPPGEPLPSAPPSEHAPVPEGLLAEIEAFKELVREQDPAATRRAAAAPPPLPEPPGLALAPPREAVALPPGPSLDLRNRLPPFSMTVHVYNPDPKRRFVYINGRKLAEREESREGLRLEQVVTDGAVLSYQGERFFQRR